jgi:hypothetical protein
VRARLLIWIALGALLVVLPSAALGGSSRSASNSTTFADSTGEDANAPDITSVVVSNDDAGNIVVQINISNRPALTADMFILTFLDSDQKGSTGDPDSLGADYLIVLTSGAVDLLKWNGSEFVLAPSQASLTYSYATAGSTIRISASDLGKPKAFNFGVVAASGFATDAAGNGDLTNVRRDFAPDLGHGLFTYQVLTRLVLSVTSYSTAPKPARAGKSFSASLAATENDTNGPVTSGAVTCAATIAFKRIVAVAHVLSNGVANCVWRLPADAKGKTLRGAITLTVRGVKVSRAFSARIT